MEQEQPTDSVKGVVQRRVNYREVFNHASWFAIGVLTPDGRVLEISNIVLDESSPIRGDSRQAICGTARVVALN